MLLHSLWIVLHLLENDTHRRIFKNLLNLRIIHGLLPYLLRVGVDSHCTRPVAF
uniref:Uncharacterized protein n=1 Tax=Anopheles christyi TaxID=43041 RepID=A0A182KIV9_9DIPT